MFSMLALLALGTLFHDAASFPMEKRILEDIAAGKGNMSKILNGEQAKPGEYPFAVSLEVDKQHFCGGSVISKYWVVSAAHCFPLPNMKSMVQVRVGTTKQGVGGSLHDLQEIITHPEYNEPTLFNNDIALVKVKEPFSLGSDVKSVRLAGHEDFLDQGTDVFSAGWGITTKTGQGGPSPNLLKADLQVVDRKKCNNLSGIRRLRKIVKALAVTHNMICARSPLAKDTTQGDSGGPLLRREDGEFVLVGVVSWGEGHGDLDSPGVYTDVAKYHKWIYSHTHSQDWSQLLNESSS